ncbi:hypothetical protein J1614_011954 [Plenodomus biglobosus]|nr:hypothetical protein J1614_011954 [Plenodomus biglobosus]
MVYTILKYVIGAACMLQVIDMVFGRDFSNSDTPVLSFRFVILSSALHSHSLNTEKPNIRSFSLIPGVIASDMVPDNYKHYAIDDPLLPGGLTLFLCTERAEWLRGNVISVNWDIEEMEAHREEIVGKKLLKLKFTGAKFGKGGHPWETGIGCKL